ncbi:MAG: hypothetical protein K2K08_08830 [Paramuribaculum sp.]|nr:hypothetical protein [Paramuribaculum sp.]
MKIAKFLSACAILASIAFSSCNSETTGSSPVIAFVNYDGTATDGYSQFVYSVANSNETITFRSRVAFNDGVSIAVGTRILGQFVMEYGEELKNGSVIENQGLFGLTKYGTVSIETISGNPSSTSQFYLQSIMRAGKYLDIIALANAKNSDLTLVCDASTMLSDTPVLYLNYESQSTDVAETQYFASFDISPVISQPNVKNIRVIIDNSNGNNEFIFPITENNK